jgi:hypothetical protein
MKTSNRTGIAGRDLLTIRRKGRCLTVHLGSNSRILATVEPDEVYPGLYRVWLPGGSISDLCNQSRAVDAAIVLVLSRLNESLGQETPLGAPLVLQNGAALGSGGAA